MSHSVDPYATASTPTGHYTLPESLRLTEIEYDELKKHMSRRQSFSDLKSRPRQSSKADTLAMGISLFKSLNSYLENDAESITQSIAQHAEYTLARTPFNLDSAALYRATAHSTRDRLIEHWNETQQYWNDQDPKRVYYLSLEFLIGRCLHSHLINLDLQGQYAQAIKNLGYKLEQVYQEESDPALGNGGLGRLAACFLDSMATLNYPAWGYGIRYQYGMFEQHISEDGSQTEFPDFWLTQGNPWEIERLDVTYPVRFYGQVTQDEHGRRRWTGGEVVQAVAYDMPIPGYDTYNVANLRLWDARPSKVFDLAAFNEGNYVEAINSRQRAEQISSVLYPNDNSMQGKELRLKQQYFFVSATLRDILRRFMKVPRNWSDLSKKIAVQLNDTHPSLGIAELMRILVDEENQTWEFAWKVTQEVFAYTNHTVLPEALEKWSVGLLHHLLPRHLEIIYELNHIHLQEVAKRYPGDNNKLQVMSLVEEGYEKKIRMANLAIIGSHTVNGVAALHTDLIKSKIFPEFHEYFPGKFQNKTNGVTPRRWILLANPALSATVTKWIETSEWVTNLELLSRLRVHANNPDLQAEWSLNQRQNKERLAAFIHANLGIEVDPKALFDVQIKRIHEYKRQFLNILYSIRRYLDLKKMTPAERAKTVPRVVIFAGKAAPGYHRAKLIIKLINSVARVVNSDHETKEYLKVVFIPNYNVSNAEIIIPASELSQHISTAGFEASGTSNMKFAMNGCLIIGTWDGANIEICEEIGEDNMFMFGLKDHEVDAKRHEVRFRSFPVPADLFEVMGAIRSGLFGFVDEFAPLIDTLDNGTDYYIVSVDWPMYVATQKLVDEKYKNRSAWLASSILSTAGSGLFSTDRTITQYAEEIWKIKPCVRPLAEKHGNQDKSRSVADHDLLEDDDEKPSAAAAEEKNGKRGLKKKK